MMAAAPPTSSSHIPTTWWGPPAALVLAAATFVRLGLNVDAAAWAVAQVTLVVLAAHDLVTRRLPNAITIPVALLAVGARAAFERSALDEVILAGLVAFGAFLVLSLLLRSGLGMGDVKLAGMLGFLLGSAVVPALLIGVFAGGIAAAALMAGARATRRTYIAYGPYLALGGAIAILAFHPPSLV